MNYPISVERLPLLCLSLVGLFVASCGCRPADEVTTRIVKILPESKLVSKTTSAAGSSTKPAVPAAERGEPTHRMLAAILKGDEQVWFLKVVAPIEAIASAKPPLEEFLQSVRLEKGKPVWELPEGWTEKPASQMRLATLVVPAEGGPAGIELSVIGLPLVGEWPAQVLSNVNRWRKQLGREPVAADGLSEVTTPLTAAEGATLMDETGWYASGGMAPSANAPFANAPFAQKPAPAKPVAPVLSLPTSTELKYETPEGWTEKLGSSMRKASFATPDGAEVTAFAFPATAPAMADPLANINRWRREIGLEPTTAEELARESSEMPLSGGTATYAELVGDSETTHAAMTTRGERVWFFKLRGPNEAVEAQGEAFKAWLASMQIQQ